MFRAPVLICVMPILDYIDSHLHYGVAGSLVCLFVYKVWIYPHLISPLRKIPGPPLGNFILGQSLNIICSEIGTKEKEWIRQYGPTIRVVGAFGSEHLIFMKPEALRKVLVDDRMDYPRPGFMTSLLGLTAGFGLLTVWGDEHKHMRKAMNPAFSLPNLISQTSMYHDPIESLIKIFNDIVGKEDPANGAVIPIYDWMNRLTLDIICQVAFGYEADSLHNPHNELVESYHLISDLQTGPNMAKMSFLVTIPGFARLLTSKLLYKMRHILRRLPFISILGDFVEGIYRIKQISKAILAEKLQELQVPVSEAEAKRDIMSILVRARKAEEDGGKGGYAMNDRAMTDQVMTFLGAGHETTSSQLAWSLWLLASSPEHQQRLRQELEPIFADEARPEYRALQDLPWLDGVVMECIRLLPAVPMVWREAMKTDHIDRFLVPKGTLIYIAIRVINCYKEVWGEDADEFSPVRWFDLPKDYQPGISLASFNTGPHACIGKAMSIIELKMTLAYVIYHFKFEPSFAGQKANPGAAITFKPTDGLPLRVKSLKRTSSA